jgi:hypothetical protein
MQTVCICGAGLSSTSSLWKAMEVSRFQEEALLMKESTIPEPISQAKSKYKAAYLWLRF